MKFVVLLVAIASLSVCDATCDTLGGTCMDSQSCTGVTRRGLCPGPRNIQCCIAGAGGGKGSSSPSSSSSNGRRSWWSNLFSGGWRWPWSRPATTKETVPPPPLLGGGSLDSPRGRSGRGSNRSGSCSARGGSCMSTSQCFGTSVQGLCPGPSDVQCCLASRSSPPKSPRAPNGRNGRSCSSRGGSCMATSQCSGNSVPGLCPGPRNIQCCLGGRGGGGGNDGGGPPSPSPPVPSGGQMKGVDCTSAQSVSALRAQGIKFVVRYVLGGTWKRLRASEVSSLHKAGILVGVVAETGTHQMDGGFSAGARDARLAVQQASAAGAPSGIVIYFAHDEESDLSSVPSYLDGAASVLGANRVGIYGGRQAILNARSHWQSAHPGGRLWLWQTLAWSGSSIVQGVDLYQGGAHAWGGSYARDSWNGCDKDTAFGSAGLF